ncbi:kinase-like protein, partial [Rhizoclosmatium globosum]
QGYYDRFFIEIKKLGRGLRGSVFLVQHVLDTVYLGDYAVKSIPIGSSHSWLVRQLQEVHLLERLRHPNIVHYKHAWIENKQLSVFGPEVPCLFILMELANGGSLEDYIYLSLPSSDTSDAYHDPSSPNSHSTDSKEKRLHRLNLLRQRQTQQRLKKQDTAENLAARTFGGIGTDAEGKRVRYLTKQQIWSLFLDICEGLAHLHRNGIIHRDLKPPNLLL